MIPRILAVIPARGGSKGLPGKNIRPLAGLPLIVHTIRFAALCPEITRTIVSTDSEEIAAVARSAGADVPFLRPVELAADDTPMWPVIQHALRAVAPETYDYLLLIDPTTPFRLPEDIHSAFLRLSRQADADGIIGVSQPDFNPIWHCVVEENGFMKYLIDAGKTYGRRQDVPPVYRINASLYLWRSEFVFREKQSWMNGRSLLYEIPDQRAVHIDTIEQFKMAEILIERHMINAPWLSR